MPEWIRIFEAIIACICYLLICWIIIEYKNQSEKSIIKNSKKISFISIKKTLDKLPKIPVLHKQVTQRNFGQELLTLLSNTNISALPRHQQIVEVKVIIKAYLASIDDKDKYFSNVIDLTEIVVQMDHFYKFNYNGQLKKWSYEIRI